MQSHWENELADLLRELTSVQEDLLQLLAEKQALLARAETDRVSLLQSREESLLARLEGCHLRRKELLEKSAREGRPANSLRNLASALPPTDRKAVAARLDQAETRGRLLRHQSLANWVLAQRTLLHLSQLLEIIATGGRVCPTYEEGASTAAAGALINEAV
ncbi:MAG: flagellar export chaperone FlgN [Pirellulales bacterium]